MRVQWTILLPRARLTSQSRLALIRKISPDVKSMLDTRNHGICNLVGLKRHFACQNENWTNHFPVPGLFDELFEVGVLLSSKEKTKHSTFRMGVWHCMMTFFWFLDWVVRCLNLCLNLLNCGQITGTPEIRPVMASDDWSAWWLGYEL